MDLFKNLFLFYLKQMIKSPFYIGIFLFMIFMLIVRFIIKMNESFDYMDYGDFVGEMMMIVQAVMLLIIVYFYKAFSDEFRFGATNLISGFFRVSLLKIFSLLAVHTLLSAIFIGIQIILIGVYFRISGIPFTSFYTYTALYITVYWYLPLLFSFFIGIFTALLFGKNKIGLVFVILCWIAIGPMNTTFFYQFFQRSSHADIESLFYIGPLSSEVSFNDLIGYNVTLSSFLKIIFWIFSFAGLMMFVLIRTTRTAREKGILVSLSLLLLILNVFIFPYIFSNGKLAFNFADQEAEALYYKKSIENIPSTQLQYEVVDYEIKLDTRKQVKAETTLSLTNVQSETLGFSLYHEFNVKKVTNQKGQILDFTQQGDFISVPWISESMTDKITFFYTMKDSALLPVTENYLFLPNAVNWIPTKSSHSSFEIDTVIGEGVNISSVQNNQPISYVLSFKGNHPIYTNLSSKEKGIYAGEVAGGITVLSGMLTEQKVGNKTIVYPNSWTTISENWQAFEKVLTNAHNILTEMFQLHRSLPDQIILLSFKRDAYTSFMSTDHLLYFSGSKLNISSQTNEIPSIYINALLWNDIEQHSLNTEQMLVFNELLSGYIHEQIKIDSPHPYVINGMPLYLGFEKNDLETQQLIIEFYEEFYSLAKEKQKYFLVLWYEKMSRSPVSWPEVEQLLQEFKESEK